MKTLAKFQRAAKRGQARAQFNLGLMYGDGRDPNTGEKNVRFCKKNNRANNCTHRIWCGVVDTCLVLASIPRFRS